MNRTWAPGYLAKWVFSQDQLWVTADGRCLKVADMDLEHVLNTLLMLERVSLDIRRHLDKSVDQTPLYAALHARIYDRLFPKLPEYHGFKVGEKLFSSKEATDNTYTVCERPTDGYGSSGQVIPVIRDRDGKHDGLFPEIAVRA